MPTPNATTAGAYFDINSKPESGIVQKLVIYIDGKSVYTGSVGQTGVTLEDGGVYNGTHHLVVKIWDGGGNVLQAAEYFTVVDGNYRFCAMPTIPGINMCVPSSGAYYPLFGIPAYATVLGYSSVSSLTFYLDGKAQLTTASNPVGTALSATTAGAHTVGVVAKDSSGHTFQASKTVHAYYSYSCSPKGGTCLPGILLQNPYGAEYVTTPFLINATVENNPKPITKMEAFIGGTLVASSTGPSIYQHVSGPNGTWILRVDAWDTAGHLYRTLENININVAH